MDNTPSWLQSILGAAGNAANGLLNKAPAPAPAPVVKKTDYKPFLIGGGVLVALLVVVMAMRSK